jgi:hypothetical protein
MWLTTAVLMSKSKVVGLGCGSCSRGMTAPAKTTPSHMQKPAANAPRSAVILPTTRAKKRDISNAIEEAGGARRCATMAVSAPVRSPITAAAATGRLCGCGRRERARDLRWIPDSQGTLICIPRVWIAPPWIHVQVVNEVVISRRFQHCKKCVNAEVLTNLGLILAAT